MPKFEPLLVIVALCAACGSKFEASGAGGAAGSGQGGEQANGGKPGSAGSESGGSAGQPGAGSGGTSAGGSHAGGASAGGASAGGAGGAAAAGSGGSGGAADCATLKEQYRVLVEKARVCSKGSTDQCSATSTLPPIGCGCPVLVNAKSESTTAAKQKYQAIQDGKCDGGPICNIACLPYTGAGCLAQTMGPGDVFVCTPTDAGIAN